MNAMSFSVLRLSLLLATAAVGPSVVAAAGPTIMAAATPPGLDGVPGVWERWSGVGARPCWVSGLILP